MCFSGGALGYSSYNSAFFLFYHISPSGGPLDGEPSPLLCASKPAFSDVFETFFQIWTIINIT
jgi:hypothetical protein